MKVLKMAVVTLFLLAVVFASFGFAQNKPATGATPAQQALGMMFMQVKPGMGLEWENYLKKDLIPAAKKGGMAQLNTLRTDEFGVGDHYILFWPIKSLAELDGPDPFEKSLGPDGLVVLLSNIQRCVASTRTFILTDRPDLSILPKPGYEYKMGVLVTVTVAPGRTGEYEKNVKEMIAVLAKTNAKAVHTGSVGLGGNPNQYLIYVAFDNFADLEKFIPVFNKAASEAKLSPETGIVMQSDMQAFKGLPELSIQ
jgi:hypothetical protein